TSEDSSGSGSRSLSISRSVTAGTYYVKVRHHSSTGTGVYALSTSFTPAPAPATPVSDDYGNTRNTAATIGTTSTTLGDIETAGDVDYFEINITSAGTLVVNTTGSTDTAGFLYNASGTQIGYDNNSGTDTNFKISKKVVAGTYYVKVSASSSGNYALVSQVITDDYGNTKNTAATIGTTSTTSGDIETAGDVDYFEINIPSTGTLVATLSSPTDINISLYNAGGTYITSEDSSGSGSRSLSISQSITAGTYYVKVRHHSSTGTGIYALSTRFTASIPVSDDYGNTKNTAATIGTTSTTLGSIETARDVDWFKVIITSAGTLVVETTGSTDTNGVLYNASGAQIGYDNNSGTDTNFKISKKVVAGTYYVKVSASSSGNYALVSQVITDDYGNTKNTAATIGTTSTTSGD
ncbi:MAG: pre-peptidase C-terminal domain-containing protein, partial [Sulfurovum sp.]|nr:pre-peptidase C-terminal domain-containing protein [Sulfurovum sp.]